MQTDQHRPAPANPELERIRKLEEDLAEVRKAFTDYKLERQKEESKKLKTALIAAGGVILTLGSFVWMEVVWPVIQMGRSR